MQARRRGGQRPGERGRVWAGQPVQPHRAAWGPLGTGVASEGGLWPKGGPGSVWMAAWGWTGHLVYGEHGVPRAVG